MKILLTGYKGFIGSNMLNALKDQSATKMLQDRVAQMFGTTQRLLPTATAITAGSQGGDISGGLLGR
mgnify:CR=1 FL=1